MSAVASAQSRGSNANLVPTGERQPRGKHHGQAIVFDRRGGDRSRRRAFRAGIRAILSVERYPHRRAASARTPPDILARIVANALSDGEGWKVIVENKPGAVMTIGATEVLKQPADGHTLFSITAPFAAVPALVPNA